jgi:hypothetical protein
VKSVKSVFGSVAMLSIQSQFLISEFRLSIYKVENLLNLLNLRANSVPRQKKLNKKIRLVLKQDGFFILFKLGSGCLPFKLFTKTKKITTTHHNL